MVAYACLRNYLSRSLNLRLLLMTLLKYHEKSISKLKLTSLNWRKDIFVSVICQWHNMLRNIGKLNKEISNLDTTINSYISVKIIDHGAEVHRRIGKLCKQWIAHRLNESSLRKLSTQIIIYIIQFQSMEDKRQKR